MLRDISNLLRQTISGFIRDEALTRGAAIAFYSVTSLAPILLIVVSVAGLIFGKDAARGAIVHQFGALIGGQTAEFIQAILASASDKTAGALSSFFGVITLLITASGVFGEMQTTLNKIWKTELHATTMSGLLKARAASLGLVVAMGFLLTVSLAISAGLAAFSQYLTAILPWSSLVLGFVNTALSFLLIAALFGAIFKVLPDRHLEWRDVTVGAAASSFLFAIGKYLIALYLGSSNVATAFGAAGSLILLLFWVYYSVQIFLLGAEFTKAYANGHGSHVLKPVS